MYIQRFVKGIPGEIAGGISWQQAKDMLRQQVGIQSNWLRSTGHVTPPDIAHVLTDSNLDRHLHDYDNYGRQSPFISLAAGCVERDSLLKQNHLYSAVDTALAFATGGFAHPGVLFFGWVLVGLNPAVELSAIAEPVRELNVYRRWSPYQLEGEITAKIHIPANQIERVEWWDFNRSSVAVGKVNNPHYQVPTPVLNFREYF